MQRLVKSILVVEDDDSIRHCMVQLLRLEGYQVIAASNGKDALKLLPETPCLIFLDLMMPVMDGWELLERLNQMKSHHIPIVISSAISEGVKISGATAVIKKPYQIETILNLAKKYYATRDLTAL